MDTILAREDAKIQAARQALREATDALEKAVALLERAHPRAQETAKYYLEGLMAFREAYARALQEGRA